MAVRPETNAPALAGPAGKAGAVGSRRTTGGRLRRRYSLLTSRDKVVLTLMVGIPLAIDLIFIWGPTIASVALSFTNWDGIRSFSSPDFKWLGLTITCRC